MSRDDTAILDPHNPDTLDDYPDEDLLAAGVEPPGALQAIASTASRDLYYRMVSGFSYHVLGRPLRSYQKEVAAAILESVVKGLGLTFTVMMARQMGKNELSAHVEAGLLARHARPGDTIVKAAPTFRPQVTTSLQRLESLLKGATITRRVEDSSLVAGLARRLRGTSSATPGQAKPPTKEVVLKQRKEHGYQLALGDARAIFLSADPSASVVGATASLLLEVDEAQDVDPEKFSRDFRPMASAHNATTVLYGTAWTQDTLLEQQKQANLQLQSQDGIRRHFQYDWLQGAAAVPAYGQFVRAEIERLSLHHPLIRTQYLLRPLSEAGAFFTPDQRALLQGTHPRQTVPGSTVSVSPSSPLSAPGRGTGGGVSPAPSFYVAAVDVAGPAEEPTDADALLRATLPRKDSTVVLIAQVTRMADGPNRGPALTKIVQVYWWTGRPLHEQCDRLISLLKDTWKCRRVVVDASGLGADMAGRLQRALGATVVEPFVFTVPSKSDLAYALLAHTTSGRLQMWSESAAPPLHTVERGPGGEVSPESAEFWREIDRARPIHRSEGKLGFYVPEHYGHDDFLTALALLSRAAQSATAFPEPARVILRPVDTRRYDDYGSSYGHHSWTSRLSSWLPATSPSPLAPPSPTTVHLREVPDQSVPPGYVRIREAPDSS